MPRKIAALLFIGLSVWTVIYSLSLKMYTSEGPGAGLFPLGVGVILGILGILWLVQLVREPSSEPSFFGGRWVAARVGSQVLALIAFTVMLHPAGFISSAFLLVVVSALIAGERNWVAILAAAVLGSIGIQYLFALLGTRF